MNDCTSFWLVRHAPVVGSGGIIHPPEAHADLRERGHIERVSKSLPPDAVGYCSPTVRTRETARALGVECTVVPDLREQNFGKWFGRRHDELAVTSDQAYRRFWSTPASSAPPEGESFVEQIERTRSAIARIEDRDAVLVVHSGTIRAVLAIALSLAAERALSFVVDHLSVTKVDRVAGGWRVNCVNATT